MQEANNQNEPDVEYLTRAPRRRRRHRHSSDGSNLSKLLWISLCGLLFIYLLALVLVHRSKKPTVAAGPSSPPPVSKTNDTKVVQEVGVLVDSHVWDDHIQKWTTSEDLAQEAELKIHQGRLEEAEKKLRTALQLNPDSAHAQLALARICYRISKYDEVLSLLNKVLAADPGQATAKLLLAQTFAAMGQFAPTLSAAKWIMATDPYSMEAHQLAAIALINLKQPAEAVDHLRKIINVDHENISAYNLLADAYTQMGLDGKVIEVLNEIRKMDPNNSVACYNLAVCYARQNMVTQTVDTLTQSMNAFGPAFVHTWMEAHDFDGLRDNEAFKKLSEQLNAPLVPGATASPTTP